MTGNDILQVLADGKPRLTREIAAFLQVQTEAVGAAARCLKKKGLVCSSEGVHGITAAGLQVVKKGLGRTLCKGQAGQSNQGLRHRAWQAMQMVSVFSVNDLLDVTATGYEADAEANLKNYCKALFKAGMLIQTRSGKYFLREKDKGEHAPSYNRKAKTVTNRNTGEVFYV
jgi:hypothetical protein